MPDGSSASDTPIAGAAPATFGDLLRRLRLQAGLTQQELGQAVGYSHAQIARLEGGKRLPDVAAVRSLFVEGLGLKPESADAARLIERAGAAREGAPGELPAEEPPRRILNNLPAQPTSFIGRERELDELQRLLATTRLLTLTGSGGTGKTRLALQLAQRAGVMEAHPDGVWLVELAPVSDPAFVLRAIAAVLGAREEPSRPLLAVLLEALRAHPGQLLLILDNCEHMIDVCAQFADAVLRSGANARILATSREGLGVAGEQSWRVTSLQMPAAGVMLDLDTLTQVESVRLFVERARLVLPAFALAAANAPAVRQIVTRLDGIPLAIELAAARVKALPAETIAGRLNDAFRLLTGGSRTALPRQQTLRGAIDWSYRLLNEEERVLLRRLAVFVGGWTLEAAEAVCADDGIERDDILDLLTHLVDKSLVVTLVGDGGEITRYGLLETIRQYAREKLADTAEGAWLRDRHLDYLIRLGQEVGPQLMGDGRNDPASAVKRLAPDLDNLRSALEWSLETGRVSAGLQMVDAHFWMWILRAAQSELIEWHERLLARPLPPTQSLGLAFTRLSWLHGIQGDWDTANAAAERALSVGVTLNDWELQGEAYSKLAMNHMDVGNLVLARDYAERCRDTWIAGHVADKRAESLAYLFGYLALYESDFKQAQVLLMQSHQLLVVNNNKIVTSSRARTIGYTLLYQNEPAQAGPWLCESLVDNAALGDKQAVAACLAAFAAHALVRRDVRQSARLFGASEALCEAIRTPLQSWDVIQARRNVAELRKRMDAQALAAAWADGRTMSMQQAIDLALAGASGEPVSL